MYVVAKTVQLVKRGSGSLIFIVCMPCELGDGWGWVGSRYCKWCFVSFVLFYIFYYYCGHFICSISGGYFVTRKLDFRAMHACNKTSSSLWRETNDVQCSYIKIKSPLWISYNSWYYCLIKSNTVQFILQASFWRKFSCDKQGWAVLDIVTGFDECEGFQTLG